MDLTFFDGRSEVSEQISNLVFVSAQTTSGDGEAERSISVPTNRGVFVFSEDTRVDWTPSNGYALFVDLVSENITELN